MGAYLVRVKVMPSGPEVPSDKLLESIKGVLGKEMTLRASKEDPIAFGLYALIVDIVAPEEEGMVDKVEAAVSRAPGTAALSRGLPRSAYSADGMNTAMLSVSDRP